jgi:hypothetical protein
LPIKREEELALEILLLLAQIAKKAEELEKLANQTRETFNEYHVKMMGEDEASRGERQN